MPKRHVSRACVIFAAPLLALSGTDAAIAAAEGETAEPVRLAQAERPIRLAQAEPPARRAREFGIEEIVVTARRREESLQDTPISITAVTADALVERDITSIQRIDNIAPNMDFSYGGTSSGSGSAAVVYIRGVGQNDFTPVTDPGVGIYVDGVYLGRTVGSVLDVLDLAQVEVLRGPQGTLFGRNTIGGAINLTTRDPGDELGGRVRLLGGDDARGEFYGTLDVPVNETLGITVAALYKQQDGYVTRVLDGTELGDEDVLGARAKLVWEPSDRWRVEFVADGAREREESAPEVAIAINPLLTPGVTSFADLHNLNPPGFNTGASPACAAGGGPLTDPTCANDQWLAGNFATFETGPSQNDVDQWGFSLTATWSAGGGVTLKSITAYRELNANFARSSDATPFDIFSTEDAYDQEQFSQEFQAFGTAVDDRLDWLAGVYYFQEEAFNVARVRALIPVFPFDVGGFTDNWNYAIFGEATFDVTDRFHITGGVRFTDEEKGFDPISQSDVLGVFIPRGEQTRDFDKITWRASAAFDFTDAVTAYATFATGFKSGGFVLRNTGPVPNDQVPTYEEETVEQYEIGVKLQLTEIGLRASAAYFFSDYEDIQVAANIGFATVTQNAAGGEVDGFEAEVDWVPVPQLNLSAALGITDAEFTEIGPGATVSLDDDFIRTPEVTWNFSASYIFSLAGDRGSISPRIDWHGKEDIHFEPDNNQLVFEDGYNHLDASVAYENADQIWRVRLGVNNLTDEEYLIAGDSNDTIGYALAVFARPRTYFASLEYSF